ncbi:MAG TPA: bifunctional serine/threonine-protein kinase/formylglycine-generating enzyme family protein [Anaerolineae bacterium]|nr:bifunctional serine/threonine-protein kinase/formylglycine-generating enzyme family protein [Anaerolineae bacterium]
MSFPERIGKYEILAEIGYGGFAAVYKAHDSATGRIVALKVMHTYWQTDAAFVRRFRREGFEMSRLHHPNIVTVYESGEWEQYLYIAMEYLAGRTLNDVLKSEITLSLERTVSILEPIASALDYAHRQGVIHRDIKPANVLLDESGGRLQVTLLDFGLVKALAGSSALTSQGMLVGSPEYMAPEQANLELRRDVGSAADRYSLGVLAYRMLTGRVPFPGNTPATLNAHEHKPVPPPQEFRPDLPDEVADTLLKMLAKNPGERFPTAGAFVAQLRVAADTQVNVQERDTQLTALYGQLDVAAREHRWREVLGLAGEIQTLDRHYRDVQSRLAAAQQALGVQSASARRRTRWWRGLGIVGASLALVALFWSWRRLAFPATLPHNAKVGQTWTRPTDGMTLVYVPPGMFLMGAADGDPDEQPVHSVTLAGFWLDRTEVSEAQYAQCVSTGACRALAASATGPNYPAVGVSWEDATAYCAWAGARLPTEAEWEYAYRGVETRIYTWGNTFDPVRVNFCDMHCSEMWSAPDQDDGYAEGAPVESYVAGASWCGARNLAGNAWEWVGDWYHAEAYATAASQNPTGPASGTLRVLRGGSWSSPSYNVRGSYRFSGDPTQSDPTWGFRCAQSR